MTEQVKLESICPSCGKTDKLLWPDGCKNTWHIEGCGAMSEIQRWSTKIAFTHEYMMVDNGEGEYVFYADHTAALRQRDERIAALEAENAVLRQQVETLQKQLDACSLGWA